MGDAVSAVYVEAAAQDRVAELPLAHLSIELGHLYMEDYIAGPARLRETFEQVAPWVRTAMAVCGAGVAPRTARISTCFLVDDYFTRPDVAGRLARSDLPWSPRAVIPQLLLAAEQAGLTIDYLARESACAVASGVPLASLVQAQLVPDPAPGASGVSEAEHEAGWLTNGTREQERDLRPPTAESGWRSNGASSPAVDVAEAMRSGASWRGPSENGAGNHSVFIDVELWRDEPDGRLWSCAFLASVWQLLRLGMVRDRGAIVAEPQLWEGEFPEDWADLPPVIRLRPEAAHFSAYRTFSVLAGRFLPVEQAVRTILSQVAVERAVTAQVQARAKREQLALPAEVVDRIEYAFTGSRWR
ncbi:SCO2522 family protein [Catellatospora bangladeshensis]|uniref:SCO2522 family protein n=1 Tax=Catellatospora bangladeshensis TaxID=310355 RepID=UPI001EF1B566|nr:SCO2522 family protein [Catellatospora bangladeshensis]